MPSPALDPREGRAPIPFRDAAMYWAAAWLLGTVLASLLTGLSGASNIADVGIGWLLAASIAQWAPLLAVVWVLGKRFGTGNPVTDYGLRFKPIDLLGVPMGVVTQLVVISALYWPLRQLWPGTFDPDEVEQRARDLWNSTSGLGLVVLVAVVAFGAPLVEEIVYRGLLQGSMSRRLGQVGGLVLAAAWFALIHFQPVEYPGLFVAGLVFGLGLVLTDRLGMGILAHMAFNVTGLVMVATR